MSVAPLQAIAALPGADLAALRSATAPLAATPGIGSFAHFMLDGVKAVDHKVVAADAMARAFVLDDSMPVHQVTYALEQARMSLELMMQVRTRLVEAFQQLQQMQL